MEPLTVGLLIGGLVLLAAGGEAVVRGASRLATVVGISPLVVGLTVVAFGTSAPEAAVVVQAAAGGRADIAVGNVVGSNIFNVLFVLGISAAVTPLVVSQRLVYLDVPIMIGVSILALVLMLDGDVSRFDGLLLFGSVVAYTIFVIHESRRERAEVRAEYEREFGRRAPKLINPSAGPAKLEEEARPSAPLASTGTWGETLLNLGLVAIGIGLLVLGARWVVEGAVVVAEVIGVTDLVIGLTIIAAGTSLPELATAVVASLKGERDIAVGNIVGSNIFNLLFVLGVAGVVAPDGIPAAPAVQNFDLPVMIAVAVACLPIAFTGHCIDRWEGFLFLGYYAAYAAFLILEATAHAALPAFSLVMLQFVLPITVITLVALFVRAVRLRAARSR